LLYFLYYIIQGQSEDFLKVFRHIKFHVYTVNDATASSISTAAGMQVAGMVNYNIAKTYTWEGLGKSVD
jgi:hypothetical protein